MKVHRAMRIAALNGVSKPALTIALRDLEAREPVYLSDPVEFIRPPKSDHVPGPNMYVVRPGMEDLSPSAVDD